MQTGFIAQVTGLAPRELSFPTARQVWYLLQLLRKHLPGGSEVTVMDRVEARIEVTPVAGAKWEIQIYELGSQSLCMW